MTLSSSLLKLAKLALAMSLAAAALGQGAAGDSLEVAAAALRSGDAARAARIATQHLASGDAPDRAALWIRANARERLERYAEAVEDYRRLAALDPSQPRLQVALGEAAFKSGDMEVSVNAFDAASALDPSIGPHLWQRGISLYYAQQYEGCARQFEVHRTVNPQDVENSVWHVLCVAATKGYEAARDGLIPIDRDGRVPMMEIFALFSGRATQEDVLAAARRSDASGSGDGPSFYAHLYLGLYYEAKGDSARSAEHIDRAVAYSLTANYMWQVARVHQAMRERPE